MTEQHAGAGAGTTRAISVSGGRTIHLFEAGQGAPVVFIHGSGPGASAMANFRGNWQAFVDAGYNIMGA